jgi:hypothetical protein
METATAIVVVAGVADVAYGFLLGVALSAIRMRKPDAPRHLTTTHLAAIITIVLAGVVRAL